MKRRSVFKLIGGALGSLVVGTRNAAAKVVRFIGFKTPVAIPIRDATGRLTRVEITMTAEAAEAMQKSLYVWPSAGMTTVLCWECRNVDGPVAVSCPKDEERSGFGLKVYVCERCGEEYRSGASARDLPCYDCGDPIIDEERSWFWWGDGYDGDPPEERDQLFHADCGGKKRDEHEDYYG